jgi:hypothetical protein
MGVMKNDSKNSRYVGAGMVLVMEVRRRSSLRDIKNIKTSIQGYSIKGGTWRS